MKKLTAAQTKPITNAKDQVKAAANVMIETPLELIKCILLKHETAVIEVMKELHDEKMRLQQQRDELVAALKLWKLASDNAEESELDDMACYCVPMPLFCDADEATEAALAKLGADKTGGE